jgi:hypothetical protein
VSSQADRFSSFAITLEGREEVVDGRHNQPMIRTEVFAAFPIVRTIRAQEIALGKATIAVAAGKMHSFKFHNGKIVWVLKVRGEIRRRPPVDEEFEITIDPPPGKGISTAGRPT